MTTHQCEDCDALGVITYRTDAGTIWLCRPCYDDRRANEEPNEPDYNRPSVRETQIREWEQKHKLG